MPDNRTVLISFFDTCVLKDGTYQVEGWGIAEYDYLTNSFTRRPIDVIKPLKSGTGIPERQWFRTPVIGGNTLTFFTSECDTVVLGTCTSGAAYRTSIPMQWAALKSPTSYGPVQIATADSTSWTPLMVSVSSHSSSFVLVELTSTMGNFAVYRAGTPIGPWTEVATGSLPGCSSTPAGSYCYAIHDHPELDDSSNLFVSYYLPGAGPDPSAGHLVMASLPVSTG